MHEWCDVTVNPIVGCSHGCPYCYAQRMAKRFKQNCQLCYDFIPHPHLERLNQLTPRQKPKRIFINSMWDWNDANILSLWLVPIIDKMIECKQHTFIILTKNPLGYVLTPHDIHGNPKCFPTNVWLGSTCDGIGQQRQVKDLVSAPFSNLNFISFEPLQYFIRNEVLQQLEHIDWIIIGAESGNRKGKVPCNRAWVEDILEACRDFKKPVFMKDNLWKEGVYWKEELIQEFPK